MEVSKESEMLREANLLSKLQHPNVIQYFGLFKLKNETYMVMEFCQHGSTETWVRNHTEASTTDLLAMFVTLIVDLLLVP